MEFFTDPHCSKVLSTSWMLDIGSLQRALFVSFSLPVPLHSSLPFFFVSPPSELFLNPEHQQRILTPNSSTEWAAQININLGEEPEFIFIYLFLSPLSDREFWRFPQLQPLLCCRGPMLPHLFTLRTQRFTNTRAWGFCYFNSSLGSAAPTCAMQIINTSGRGSSEGKCPTLLPQSLPRCFKISAITLQCFIWRLFPFHPNTSLLTSELVSDTNRI